MSIEVDSHTDNKGNDKYNLKLSGARAQAVVNYLIDKGIAPYRLSAKGYGETKPIAPNETNGKDNPDGRQLNRRTEVKITYILPPLKSLDHRKHFEYTDTSFEVGEVKIQCCIYYGFDNSGLREESFPHLDSIASFLYYRPDLSIEIGSHTDNIGNGKYNLKLSQARAQNLVDYFVHKGIDTAQLTAKGYGGSLPISMSEINGKDYPEGRQLNRRTELKISSISEANKQFVRPSLLNPDVELIRFLFGEKSSALSLSLFNIRDIEKIIDFYTNSHNNLRNKYKEQSRSYLGFINAEGDSIVMATLNSSNDVNISQATIFNSESLNSTQVLFINLSRRTCITLFPQ